MKCLWYLYSKIPSLDDPIKSVLDELVQANKDAPIHSECRLLRRQGYIYERVHDYRLSQELLLKMEHFTSIPKRNMTIEDYWGKDSEFFHSSLWWSYHSMLVFKPYHSALEAQRYFNRFGLLTRLDYLEDILHTKRNENDSIIKPIHKWLEGKGVTFRMDIAVYDLEMDPACNTVSHVMGSGWKMSLVIHDRDYYPDQREKDRDVLWEDGLFGDRKGLLI